MNNKFKLFTLVFYASIMFACEKVEADVNLTNEILGIEIETVSTENSITLKWMPVEGCSWYFVSYVNDGQELIESEGYQDLYSDTLSYELRNLIKGTEYEIKLEGKDYLYGGEILASETINVSTTP